MYCLCYDEFVDCMIKVVNGIVIGDKNYDGFNIGLLVSYNYCDKVKELLDIVKEDGGEFVVGGGIFEFGDECDNGVFI